MHMAYCSCWRGEWVPLNLSFSIYSSCYFTSLSQTLGFGPHCSLLFLTHLFFTLPPTSHHMRPLCSTVRVHVQCGFITDWTVSMAWLLGPKSMIFGPPNWDHELYKCGSPAHHWILDLGRTPIRQNQGLNFAQPSSWSPFLIHFIT